MADQLSVPAGQGVGGGGPGAIVGENPVPFGFAAFSGSGDTLTTGALSVGSAGECGGLANFAVEVWFKFSTIPGANRVFLQGPAGLAGGNQYFLQLNTTGTVLGSVRDESSANHQVTSVALTVDNWWHLVLAAEGGSVRIYVNGVQSAADATWGAHTVREMAAASNDLRLIAAATGDFYFDELAVYGASLSATRIAEHYDAGVNQGYPVHQSGERIGAVLDTVSSTAPRSIQFGARRVIDRYMSGQSPLEEMRLAVEADDVDAALFVSAGGTVTYLADGHRGSSPYDTVQATFGDAGGSEIPYEGLDVDYSPTYLINEWNVIRSPWRSVAPITQTVSDSTSISRYFKRSHSLSEVPATTNAEASSIATALLAKYKDPLQRIFSMSFTCLDSSVSEAVLERELMDKIRILRTPPGGGARFDQSVFIQSIEISGANDGKPWQVKWGVSPL